MPLPQLHLKCLNQLVFQLLFHHLSKLYCDISSIKTELNVLIQQRACNIYAVIYESLNHKTISLQLLRTSVTSFHSCICVLKNSAAFHTTHWLFWYCVLFSHIESFFKKNISLLKVIVLGLRIDFKDLCF